MPKEAGRIVWVKSGEIICGLCGNTKYLLKTECCDNWICDDEHKYPMYPSFSRLTCYRKHWKYSLCSFHHAEEHKGKWQKCRKCKEQFSEEDYKEYTSEFCNFEKLKKAPKITCVSCGFKSEYKKKFAFQLKGKHYCTKDECRKKGKPSPRKNSKRTLGVKKVSKAGVKKVRRSLRLMEKNQKASKN